MTLQTTALPTGISRAIPNAEGSTYLPLSKSKRLCEMDVFQQSVDECTLYTEEKKPDVQQRISGSKRKVRSAESCYFFITAASSMNFFRPASVSGWFASCLITL